jgi:cyclopropane fatty-acyl-phospholipid synthase-like methyltransferase
VNRISSSEEIAAYYESFSFETGAEYWRRDNGRHLRIRRELTRLLGAARGLRVLDVGCGAGVLTSELCRYGNVTGTDLSAPAVALASVMEPRARFVAGRFQELDLGSDFDLITMFDVLEHVPPDERPQLFERLDALLGERGWLVVTTPHPGYTRWLHEHRPDLLQIVDEPVSPPDVVAIAQEHGLELVDYVAYDVDVPGARQYQLFAFARAAADALALPAGGRIRRLWLGAASQPVRPQPFLKRLAHAARLVRAGRPAAARWLLGRGETPPVA